MKQFLLHTLPIGALLACSGCGGVSSSKVAADSREVRTHPRDGKADAHADLAAGKLVIEEAGLPQIWEGTYSRLLRERHGIEVRYVAGCLIDQETVKHMKAYNAVMKAEISRRFGKEALEKAATDAQRLDL